MSSKTVFRLRATIVGRLIIPLLSNFSIWKYRLLSTCTNIEGKPILNQPLLANGIGKIIITGKVNIGLRASPYHLNTYAYFDVRKYHSKIEIEDGVWINNNSCLIAEGDGIFIGRNTLIGQNFSAFDSDFHELAKDRRIGGIPKTARICIGNNVFIGSNVTILKGVSIGENTVIGSGSVVVRSLPSNVVAAGNPCKVLKEL